MALNNNNKKSTNIPPFDNPTDIVTPFLMTEKDDIQMFFIYSAKDNTNRQWLCSKKFIMQWQKKKEKKRLNIGKKNKHGLSSERTKKMKQYKTPLDCKILSSDHSGGTSAT